MCTIYKDPNLRNILCLACAVSCCIERTKTVQYIPTMRFGGWDLYDTALAYMLADCDL